MTVGLPPSTTETTEFVVPRSMPITLAITVLLHSLALGPCPSFIRSPEAAAGPLRASPVLEDVDLDLLGLDLFRLRKPDLQNAVAIRRLHAISLHRHRQLDQPLELAVGPLHVEQILFLDLILEPTFALHRQQIARDRYAHVLFADARHLHAHNQLILGGVHVTRSRPGPPGPTRRTPEKVVEEAIDFALDVGHAERLPSIHGRKTERTPTLHRHREWPSLIALPALLANSLY